MSRSAWHLIYLRVVSVVWLVRLQVYPAQSDIKAPAQELVSCRTSSLMRLFVLLFNKSSFCICMSFCCCCFCWFFTLHCGVLSLIVWRISVLSIFSYSRFCKACVIFPAFYFFIHMNYLFWTFFVCFAVASFCLEAWFDQPKWKVIMVNTYIHWTAGVHFGCQNKSLWTLIIDTE